MRNNRKVIRLTESELHNVIKESVKRILKEDIGLKDTIKYTDDNHEAILYSKKLASAWFNEWLEGLDISRMSGLKKIRYAKRYINEFENNPEYANRIGTKIIDEYADDEGRELALPYADYVGKFLYHMISNYADRESNSRTASISSKRKETQRNKNAEKYLSRFNGYSDEAKSQMDQMWGDLNTENDTDIWGDADKAGYNDMVPYFNDKKSSSKADSRWMDSADKRPLHRKGSLNREI